MRCSDANGLIMKYFDHEINDIDNLKLKQHLRTCCRCRLEIANYRNIFEEMQEIALVEPPDDLEEKVMKKVSAIGASRRRKNDRIAMSLFIVGNLLLVILPLILLSIKNSLIGSMHSIGVPDGFVWFTHKVLQTLDGIVEIFKYLFVTVYYEFINQNSILLAIVIIATVTVGIRDRFKSEKHVNYPLTQERSI